MSKASLFGLIFGLILLGTLFFMAGFLVAFSILEPPKLAPPPPPPDVWSDMHKPKPSRAATVAGGLIRRQIASSAGQLLKNVPGSHTMIGAGISSNVRSSITNPSATPLPSMGQGGAPAAAAPPPAVAPPPPAAAAPAAQAPGAVPPAAGGPPPAAPPAAGGNPPAPAKPAPK